MEFSFLAFIYLYMMMKIDIVIPSHDIPAVIILLPGSCAIFKRVTDKELEDFLLLDL